MFIISVSAADEAPKPTSARGLRSAAFYKENIAKLKEEISAGVEKKKSLSKRLQQYRWLHAIQERKADLVDKYKLAMKKKDQNAMDKIHKQIKVFYAKNATEIKKMENLGSYLKIVPKIRVYLTKLAKEQAKRKARLAAYQSKQKIRKERDLKIKSKSPVTKKHAPVPVEKKVTTKK